MVFIAKMLMTEEPRRRLSVRSNNLVLPYIDLTPTIRSVPVGSSHGSVFQAKEGGVPRPHVRIYRQADEACPRVAHKTGTYRRPRFFCLAALVPSAGTLRTLKI